MLKLFIRQLLKQWKAIIIALSIWLIGGYFFLSPHQTYLRMALQRLNGGVPVWTPDRGYLFSRLSYFFAHRPNPGRQEPQYAFDKYLLPVLQQIDSPGKGFPCTTSLSDGACGRLGVDEGVRLDLMADTCQMLPRNFVPPDFRLRPDWLETTKHWTLARASRENESGGLERHLIEPDSYWISHRDQLLASMEDLMNAMDYAYEIPRAIHRIPDKGDILLPMVISRVGNALCRPDAGILAYGDYVNFQEVRAYRDRVQKNPEEGKEEYIFPSEKELLTLSSLKGDNRYIEALRIYTGGVAPDPIQTGECSIDKFVLACYAPREALKTFNKLLYYASDRETPSLQFLLGKIYLRLGWNSNDTDMLDRAANFFQGSAQSPDTEYDSRVYLLKLRLKWKDYDKAYIELLRLNAILANRGMEDGEFRQLARTTLMGLGRFKEADCFSTMVGMPTGSRKYCEAFRLKSAGEGD